VLQCVAVCCRVLQCVAPPAVSRANRARVTPLGVGVLQCIAVCCSVLQCVAVCCSTCCVMSQPRESCTVGRRCVAVYYSVLSVLQRVAVCCCVLQCCSAAVL